MHILLSIKANHWQIVFGEQNSLLHWKLHDFAQNRYFCTWNEIASNTVFLRINSLFYLLCGCLNFVGHLQRSVYRISNTNLRFSSYFSPTFPSPVRSAIMKAHTEISIFRVKTKWCKIMQFCKIIHVDALFCNTRLQFIQIRPFHRFPFFLKFPVKVLAFQQYTQKKRLCRTLAR